MLMKSREGSLKVEGEMRDGNLGDGGRFKEKRLDGGSFESYKGKEKVKR